MNTFTNINAQTARPNILLIIADDLGVDVSNGYHKGNLMPTTPTLDSLRSEGITFENVFAAPKCSPSRAAIMSGKYGVNNGVTGTPGNLDLEQKSIQIALEELTDNAYADAVIGKWHISQPVNNDHPLEHGADYFMGLMGSAPTDYYNWARVKDGISEISETYMTEEITDESINWIAEQTKPWFLWLAHSAPHSPIHLPPEHMYTLNATGTNYRKYLAMIESVDYSTNKIISSLSEEEKANTLIIYLGDNGTPNTYIQDYPPGHGKSTMYQGGIRVPLIISGAGVSRKGERESALVHLSDLHATILEFAGDELPGGLFNSLSFDHLLNNEVGPTRDYNYSELSDGDGHHFAIRNHTYKLIEINDGVTQEFYNLITDSLETDNLLLESLTQEQLDIKADLEQEALQIQTAWSCRDYIKNGDEEEVDCGGSYCDPCVTNVEEINEVSNLILYPNPSKDLLTIESKKGLLQTIIIYNNQGQLLKQFNEINKEHFSIDLLSISVPEIVLSIEWESGFEIKRVLKL